MTGKISKIAPFAALAVSLFAVYFGVWDFEHIRFDDPDYTFRCAFVAGGFSLENVLSAITDFTTNAIWMPITYLSYQLEISFFGSSMGVHHFFNLVFHVFNSFLFLVLLRRLFKGAPAWTLLVAVAFWALHPQRVEAVAWVASRKELLCGMFVLCGLLAKGSWIRLLCCVLACASKPTGMVFPFLVLLLDRFEGRKTYLLSWSLSLLVAFAVGLLAVYSQTHPAGYEAHELFTASFPWRLLNAIVTVSLDCAQTIVPYGLHLFYRAVPEGLPIGFPVALPVAVMLCSLVWFFRRNTRVLCMLAFFAVALVPTLGIFGSFGEHARADRFLYLPALAWSVLVAMALGRVEKSWKIVAVVSFFAIAVYAFAAHTYAMTYRNDYTAFLNTVRCDADNPRALAHVGSESCARFGDFDNGIELLRKSQRLEARADTAAGLSFALMTRGRREDFDEVKTLCANVAKNPPMDKKGLALESLGLLALRERRWKDAVTYFGFAVKAPARIYPDLDARFNLAVAAANTGDKASKEAAIAIFRSLLTTGYPSLREKAARALDMISRAPDALLFF